MYEFGHIDTVCTRATNIGTSKSTHTGDAVLHTCFCLIYGMGRVCKNREYIFDIKTRGKIVPVIKLRHAKVVLSGRRLPQKKPVACIRPGIAPAGDYFPREDSLGKYRRCGRRALLLMLWSLSPLLKRSCWYVTDK